jgi:hypothetical protein
MRSCDIDVLMERVGGIHLVRLTPLRTSGKNCGESVALIGLYLQGWDWG